MIHPTAVVAPGAKLASDVEVGPYAVIGPDVELCAGVVVASHVVLAGRTRVGEQTRIFPSAVLGTEPQVAGFDLGPTRLEIGKRNLIREFVTIHAGSAGPDPLTRIGDDNIFLHQSHVAHDCRIGSSCVLASATALAGHVEVGDHVFFGAMTGVHQFARVGESAFTAANAMVSKDVPPFARVAGDRARLAGLNAVGLQRRGFSRETQAALRQAFRLLFRSGLSLATAVDRAERELGGVPEVERLIAFLRASKRGVVR